MNAETLLRTKTINRIVWMMIFLVVSAIFAWSEWGNAPQSAVGWFLATSLWSAVCGIGYSVCDWWVVYRRG